MQYQLVLQFQNTQYNYLGLFLETVNNLKKNISKVEMKGTIYNEYELLSVHKEKNDRHAIFNLNFLKMMTNIFYENYDEAILQSKEAEKYITSAMGFIVYPEYIFYDTILKLEIMKKYGLVKSIKYWKDILRNSIKLFWKNYGYFIWKPSFIYYISLYIKPIRKFLINRLKKTL